MNRVQVQQCIGCTVYLQSWPYAGPITTAKGVELYNYGVGKPWTLMQLTKRGMAVICDGVHTLSVPPFDINYIFTIKE